MLTLLGNLFQSNTQRKQYANSAAIAAINARGARAAAETRASGIEQAAAFNHYLANSNIRTAQDNAHRTLGSIRASQGASGLTTEGSGNQRYLSAQEVLDKQINDMALSASIAMGNAMQQTVEVRRTGEAQAIQYELQAAQYSAAAANVKKNMLMQGIMGVAGAAFGGITNYMQQQKEQERNGTPISRSDIFAAASQGMDYGANFGTLTSPFTAALAGDANTRKNNWRGIFAIANGNTPYHTTGQFSTYNTAW